MHTTALSDVVSDQYAKWTYPEPILDLPNWLANNWQWFDPSHAHRLFWPDRDYKSGMDILVAGCGTNQAAVIAFTNPGAQVVGVDVSQQSLAHQQFLKDKYGLKNLSLQRLPIEDLGSLNRDFDLIISTGVLHHMASPQVGMNALGACLKPDGVAAIMLYAKYGRIGVEMMQSVFRDMGLSQNEKSIQVVKDVLISLPADHPVRSYMAIAPDLHYDAGLVDTFLHGREHSYSINECLELVGGAGLVFQDLLFKAPYHPSPQANGVFLESVAGLRKEQQWAIMEQINFRNGCHFFTACRSDRAPTSYKIDFAQDEAVKYIPALRYRCHIQGQQICRHDWCLELTPIEMAVVQHVDGRRCIKDIAALAGSYDVFAHIQPSERETVVKALFQRLWILDFLAMHLI